MFGEKLGQKNSVEKTKFLYNIMSYILEKDIPFFSKTKVNKF